MCTVPAMVTASVCCEVAITQLYGFAGLHKSGQSACLLQVNHSVKENLAHSLLLQRWE